MARAVTTLASWRWQQTVGRAGLAELQLAVAEVEHGVSHDADNLGEVDHASPEDVAIFGSNCRTAIATLVERPTRFTMLVHLPDDHGAMAVRDGLLATIATLPERLRKTLTWDQGTELAQHRQITRATKMAIYFCDPHSPWQRGSSENTNGLLRQYFPKHTDLSVTHPNGCSRWPTNSTTGHAKL